MMGGPQGGGAAVNNAEPNAGGQVQVQVPVQLADPLVRLQRLEQFVQSNVADVKEKMTELQTDLYKLSKKLKINMRVLLNSISKRMLTVTEEVRNLAHLEHWRSMQQAQQMKHDDQDEDDDDLDVKSSGMPDDMGKLGSIPPSPGAVLPYSHPEREMKKNIKSNTPVNVWLQLKDYVTDTRSNMAGSHREIAEAALRKARMTDTFNAMVVSIRNKFGYSETDIFRCIVESLINFSKQCAKASRLKRKFENDTEEARKRQRGQDMRHDQVVHPIMPNVGMGPPDVVSNNGAVVSSGVQRPMPTMPVLMSTHPQQVQQQQVVQQHPQHVGVVNVVPVPPRK